MVLFAVLPWGVRSQQESGEVAPGTDPGAPAVHLVWRKLLWTTVIAAVVFGIAHGDLQGRPDPVRIPEANFQSAAFLNAAGKSVRIATKKEQGTDALLVAY